MANSEPVEKAEQSVPFIGWSHAASLFRRHVAKHAPRGKTSVLILGPTGVGKKTMAKVWQHVASREREDASLQIVDLDQISGTTITHPCIGISKRPLPNNLEFLHLGTGKVASFTEPQRQIEEDAWFNDQVSHFALRLFMPPLRERPVDILALLQQWVRSLWWPESRGSV